MTKKVWISLVVLLVVSGLVSAAISDESNVGFADNAAVLAFVTGIAVAIERIIEVLWSVVGQSRWGNWWPLNQVREAFNKVEAETNQVLKPLFTSTKDALASARNAFEQGSQQFNDLQGQLDELESARVGLAAKMENAKKLAPGSARLALAAEIGEAGSDAVERATTALGDAAGNVKNLLDASRLNSQLAIDVISSFDDNPARKVASILIGSSLGVLVVGFIGLNLFAATLGEGAGYLAGVAGIVLTGIIVGLGASPTHEIIKSLQKYKESKNQGQDVPTTGPAGAVVASRNRAPRRRGFDVIENIDFIEPLDVDTGPVGTRGFVTIRKTD